MPLTKSNRKSSEEPGPSKGDKCSSDEEDEPAPRKGKGYQHSKNKQGKMSKKSPNVINKQSGLHSSHNKTAELFRKDLISAMKMADTEILYESDYLVISDPWRQEWEKGVQVPVDEGEILPLEIREITKKPKTGDFKLPPRKYLHEKSDETYQASQHELTNMQEVADAIVRYDLDDQDVLWLQLVNDDREEMGLQLINEWNLERMIEELENQCYIKTNALKKTEEGLGIEYDEDVACDVCRMLESEDTNEMVFCDGCDICVHQACYGIQTIPEGSWLCRICALGIKPMCLLCPKRGGAMKSTKSGTKWTHVSCALWIPEVSIGCPEKMEPITKISNIPPSRWALVCCLCKERVGACIQCSVKQCKTAFHVTCGFAHNLDMKTIVDDSDEADGIHLRAYCPKHTKNQNATESESPKKEDLNENDVSEAEMAKKRSEKLKQLEEEFFTLVDTQEVAAKFYIPEEAVDIVTEYWKLKRKVNKNKPLITPKMEEEDQMQKQQQDSLSSRMKMFVHLRQDLERARNLCYMISKREKNKRQLFKLKEGVFHAQIRVLTDPDLNLSAREAEKVRQDYYFDSIYSDYGVASARSNSKQPRENLFTLENLKTPKDFDESSDELRRRGGKISHKPVRLGKGVTKKDTDILKGNGSQTTSVSVSDKSEAHQRNNIFSVDGFKILTDSTAESSEDESLATLVKSTQSSQMSRLGKVKLKEIEEKGSDGEPGDIKTIPESATKKFVPSSDLRKKLTSILQSKNMMQQRPEKVLPILSGSVTGALHVDVENSDSDMFTSDTNTDLISPVDQPRNLFDQFRVQSKCIVSSPEIQSVTTSRSRSHHRKYKMKKHIRRHKKSRLQQLSLSDQSSNSSATNKPESAVSGDADILSVGQTSHLMSDDTDHDVSSLSPTLTADASDVDYQNSSHPFSTSQLQSGKGKKRKLHRDLISSELSGKSLHLLDKTMPQLSPSPRVNPNDIYSTIDGDIYIPSGKIQVNERVIILDDPVEKRSRPKSKLKLKKQANSPVKGIISYEVVNDSYDKHGIFEDNKPKSDKHGIFEDNKPKSDPEEKRNIFDGITDKNSSETEIAEQKSEHEMPSYSPRSLRKHKKQEDVDFEAPDKKISDSNHVKSKVETRTVEERQNESLRKDVINVETRQKRTRSKSLLLTPLPTENDGKKEGSIDENFKPRLEPSRVSPPHTRRSKTSRYFHTDETDGEDETEDFQVILRKRCTYTRTTTNGRGIVLKPLPNKPALTALHDSRQLLVKEDVKKRVIANLDKIVKGRCRLGSNGFKDCSHTTIDRFVKRTSSSENVFSKPDVIKDAHSKRVSVQMTRQDLTPLQVNKSSSVNTQNDASGLSNKFSLTSPIKAAPRENVFGAHSSSRSIFNNYRIPRKVDNSASGQNTTPKKCNDSAEKTSSDDALFGDVDKLQSPGLKEQLSFEDVSRNADLAAVVKTPPKCDSAGLNEDKLDGHRSYRSQSPPSSEGSGASSRILQLDSREGTPSRRITRSHLIEDSQSPGTRSRTREGFMKASQLKLS